MIAPAAMPTSLRRVCRVSPTISCIVSVGSETCTLPVSIMRLSIWRIYSSIGITALAVSARMVVGIAVPVPMSLTWVVWLDSGVGTPRSSSERPAGRPAKDPSRARSSGCPIADAVPSPSIPSMPSPFLSGNRAAWPTGPAASRGGQAAVHAAERQQAPGAAKCTEDGGDGTQQHDPEDREDLPIKWWNKTISV